MSHIEIPLRGRDGGIRAIALVDDEDWWVAVHRWRLHNHGYAQTHLLGGTVLLHRLILPGPPEVDHINGDRLDCRRENLRVSTRALNAQNRPSQGGTSRFRGVHCRDDQWVASCQLNYRLHYIGSYSTEQEAAEAAATFRRLHLPFAVEARS